MRKILALAAFGCVATASFAQSQTSLGVTVGWYLPTSSTLRDAFGSQIFTFGVTPVSSTRPTGGSITPSFNVIGADKNGNRFLLIPATLGYEYHFTSDESQTSLTPYGRLEAGVAYYNYNINTGPVTNVSASRFGWVGDAELGVIISKTVHVSAKYYLFQQQSGISFNGLQLGVTFGLIKL